MDFAFARSLNDFWKEKEKSLNSQMNEGDTKRILIDPFIRILGYDTDNQREFQTEVKADAGRVDYAICHDGNPVIIFECKAQSNKQLTDEQGQLRRYFSAAQPEVHVAVLTNGVEYRFFGDLDKDGIMDSEPFLEVDFRDLDEDDFCEPDSPILSQLRTFTKAEFDIDNPKKKPREMKYSRDIGKFIDAQFNEKSPGEELVEWLSREVHNGRITQRFKRELEPIVKQAISEFKVRQHKALQEPSTVTTTDEERLGYQTVKNILWNIVDSNRVLMMDHETRCTIQLDDSKKSRKRICIFWFNNPQKKRLGLLDKATEQRVSISSIDEINRHAERIRATAKKILKSERQPSA